MSVKAFCPKCKKEEHLDEALQTLISFVSKVPKKITIWRGEMKGINLVDAYNQAIDDMNK